MVSGGFLCTVDVCVYPKITKYKLPSVDPYNYVSVVVMTLAAKVRGREQVSLLFLRQ